MQMPHFFYVFNQDFDIEFKGTWGQSNLNPVFNNYDVKDSNL